MKRILVVRGGAIGDFILTLPAIRLLRDSFPAARLEILGHKHITALAENRFYADATRSIEDGKLASFFVSAGELSSDLRDYFRSFDLIVSYLSDPNLIFETNVRRCSSAQFLTGPARIDGSEHAARQLAGPLAQLRLEQPTLTAQVYPRSDDLSAASYYLPQPPKRLVAIHPGSGSSIKNWPPKNWTELAHALTAFDRSTFFVIIGGEADDDAICRLRRSCADLSQSYVVHQPLTTVAAAISRCQRFVGHDSGISHIAAAVGTTCTLLFGPTDPRVWAPVGDHVRVIRRASHRVADISVGEVLEAVLATN